MSKVENFIKEFGALAAQRISLDAPSWASAVSIDHVRKRLAQGKAVNTYYEETLSEMRKRNLNVEDALSLHELNKILYSKHGVV